MSLDGAFTAVPQLRNMCSLVMTGAAAGSGIKLMRLVSKQLRYVMLDVVQGYTFNLNGTGVGLLDEMTVLQGTKLSCLRLVVTKIAQGRIHAGLNGWAAHTLHMLCFVTAMGPAIRGITRLEVDASCIGLGSEEEVANLLSQLAPACPALQQLQLRGDIRRGFLAALGNFCSNICCIELLEGGSSEALQQLHLILPSLTHCKVAAGNLAFITPLNNPCCLALVSCESLTRLDTGISILTLPMWRALPHGLKELCCVLNLDERPEGLPNLLNLTYLRCYCGSMNFIPLCNLVTALHIAPNLESLVVAGCSTGYISSFVSEVHTHCGYDCIPELVYLHDRLSSGLVVTSLMYGERLFPGLNLSLGFSTDDEDAGVFGDLADFLAALPRFPAFKGLALNSDWVQSRFPLIVKQTAAVFPNIIALEFNLQESISSGDLAHLGEFTDLQYISFTDAKLSSASLALLTSRLPSLKKLCLKECESFSPADAVALQQALSDWGSAAKVIIVLEND